MKYLKCVFIAIFAVFIGCDSNQNAKDSKTTQNIESNKDSNTTQNIESNKKLEIIAALNEPLPDMSGIAVSRDNRIFVSFPRHADNHSEFALAELVNGEFIPFPNAEFVYPPKVSKSDDFSTWLVSPHGIAFDSADNLWIIDDGKRSGINEIPNGAAKLVGIDIKTKNIIANIAIPVRNDVHLNDLRVDLSVGKKGVAFITNSSFGLTPSLFVVDIGSGAWREVLINHESTKNDENFMAFLEGQPHTFSKANPRFPIGGADGIALSDGRVYYTALSGRGLYSIESSVLADLSLNESEIKKAVKYHGERPACDGLSEDSKGSIYFSAFEQMALVKRDKKGVYSVIVADSRMGWPDGLAYANGYLYVTLGQWNRLAAFNNGTDLRQRPYLIARVKVE